MGTSSQVITIPHIARHPFMTSKILLKLSQHAWTFQLLLFGNTKGQNGQRVKDSTSRQGAFAQGKLFFLII